MKQGSVKGESVLSSDDRKASQGFVNIKSQTTEQLDELIQRQNKLLQNKFFLERLPDKGKKILSFKTELEVELKKKKEEYDTACKLLDNLSLTDKNAGEIEWNKGKFNPFERQLDSDDDDDDDDGGGGEENRGDLISPLKYIATHSGTASGKKLQINSSEIKSPAGNLSAAKKKFFYVDKWCEKYEKSGEINFKERFKPNRLRNNDKTLFITSAEKVKKRLGNKWEVTQATPPAPIYKDAVIISLAESLKLQKEQAEKLKEIEKKNATEKLLQNKSVKIGNKLPVHNIRDYRSSENGLDSSTESDEEDDSKHSEYEDEEKCILDSGEFES